MKRLGLLLACAALLVGAGCTKGGFSKRDQAGKANVFRYPIVTNPTTLDPGLVQDGDTIDLLQQIYEGLVAWDENNQVVPRLAERWDIKDGGTTYVFTIRKGVKFHNGREVKAADFKWAMERNSNKAFGTESTVSYLYDIVGVKEHFAGQTPDISGIQAPDDYTLIIKIKQPRYYFLGKLTYLISAPLPKEAVPADKPITELSQVVGTGPFKIDRYIPEQLVTLKANKDYFEGAPKISAIERQVVKDPATRLNKYKGGEFDLVMLERQDIDAIKRDPQLRDQLKAFDRPAIHYVGMNQRMYPPFRDRRVRRAIAMAIDRERIVRQELGNVNQVAYGIIPPGVPGYREKPSSAIPFDPAGARRLLAEAGYPDPSKMPPLQLSYREYRKDVDIVATAVATQLAKNLGLKVSQRTMEWGAYLQLWDRGQIAFYHMRWAADYLDPENFLSFMLSTEGPQNTLGYSNPEFDRLCAEADTSMDQPKRLQLYAQAEDIVLQDAPWVPIYFQRDFELISPRVKDLRTSLFGHLPHTKLWLSP